ITNRLDSLEPAVVRRGRFDHILEVGMHSEIEVNSMLTPKLADIPTADEIDLAVLAKELAGRRLSDVRFIVRVSCRLDAKSGSRNVGAFHLRSDLDVSPS